MTTETTTTTTPGGAALPSFGEAFKVWLKIGCLSFGGPAGQIAMMHRVLVDEKKWVDEPRFLHALELLRAVARTGGAEARDLYRLAAARRARRARSRHPVRAAGRVRDAGAEPALCARARHPDHRWRAVRHQGRRAGDRGRSAHPHRQARAQDLAAARHRGRGLRRHLFHGDSVSADRDRGGAHRLPGRALVAGAARAQGRRRRADTRGARPLAAGGDGVGDRAGSVVGAGRAGGAGARSQPRAHQYRVVLLEARGGELRRRLCAARLHGAGGGRDLRLDDRAGNGRRPRPRRDHARPADPGDAVRRLPRGVSRRRALLTAHRRHSRRGADHLGHLHAVDALDLRRRAVRRAVAFEPAAVRRARRHHRRGGRRDPQPLGLVRAARAVRSRDRDVVRPGALVCLRSAGARSQDRRARRRSRRCWRSASTAA